MGLFNRRPKNETESMATASSGGTTVGWVLRGGSEVTFTADPTWADTIRSTKPKIARVAMKSQLNFGVTRLKESTSGTKVHKLALCRRRIRMPTPRLSTPSNAVSATESWTHASNPSTGNQGEPLSWTSLHPSGPASPSTSPPRTCLAQDVPTSKSRTKASSRTIFCAFPAR